MKPLQLACLLGTKLHREKGEGREGMCNGGCQQARRAADTWAETEGRHQRDRGLEVEKSSGEREETDISH